MVRATISTETRDPAPPTLAVMNRTAGTKDGGLGVWVSGAQPPRLMLTRCSGFSGAGFGEEDHADKGQEMSEAGYVCTQSGLLKNSQ